MCLKLFLCTNIHNFNLDECLKSYFKIKISINCQKLYRILHVHLKRLKKELSKLLQIIYYDCKLKFIPVEFPQFSHLLELKIKNLFV